MIRYDTLTSDMIDPVEALEAVSSDPTLNAILYGSAHYVVTAGLVADEEGAIRLDTLEVSTSCGITASARYWYGDTGQNLPRNLATLTSYSREALPLCEDCRRIGRPA